MTFAGQQKSVEHSLKQFNKRAIADGVSTSDDKWELISFADDKIEIAITSLMENDNYPSPTLTIVPNDENGYYVSIILHDPIDGDCDLCEDTICDKLSSKRGLLGGSQDTIWQKYFKQVSYWIIDNLL